MFKPLRLLKASIKSRNAPENLFNCLGFHNEINQKRIAVEEKKYGFEAKAKTRGLTYIQPTACDFLL